jgi:hypothetical protein
MEGSMRVKAAALLTLGLALWVAGCAGRDFVRPSADSLRLGKTTYAEIVARFGSPYREGTMLKNEHIVKTISYAYSTKLGESPAVSGITPARATGFYFVDLVLVGHEFTSSFEKDHTDFDETKITQIKKGETTKDQVIALIGQPTGTYIFPLVQRKDENGLVYLYSQTRVEPIPFAPKIKQYRKVLVVSVGENGVVTDVTFNASGEK